MSRPIAGKQYTVVKDDTLSGIAASAYGDGRRWRVIWRANESRLRSGDPNLIFPGEVIFIPRIAELEQQGDVDGIASSKGPEELTLVIDGVDVPIESARVLRSLDTGADGWSATILYDVEDTTLTNLISPYKYNGVEIYLGRQKVLTGNLYTVSIELSPEGVRKQLSGASLTADMIDSTMRAPYEFKGLTLKQIAETVAKPYQVSIIFDDDPGGAFKRVTAGKEETIFSFLSKLSKQRSLLTTNDADGNLVFTKAKFDSHVGSVVVGSPPLEGITVDFDGRKRYNVYKALSQRRGRVTKKAIAKDNTVSLSRFKTFTVNDTTGGDIQQAADWERSKQLASSLNFNIPVQDWYSPTGDLWEINTLVSARSDALYIPDGFDFLIRSVEYSLSNDGVATTLGLMLPQAYTGEPIEEPWLR
jgi:prophage tail gpP-like protein